MATACQQRDCTVAQTNKCLLNNDPERCPNRLAVDVSTTASVAAETAPLKEPEAVPTFPAGLALSVGEASELMESRYCHLIGILGPPGAGKTAAIVCLYLLLAHNRLTGYEFRDSRSLMGLEEISRGARRWKEGDPPGQLTVHTEAKDERVAGFIHLRMLRTEQNEPIDILFPDLPGEWSEDLVDKNYTDRLSFLRAAEAIWLIVDGVELAGAKRQLTLHRITLLMQRVVLTVGTEMPLLLVVSRRDKGTVPEASYASLLREAARLSISLEILHIASFSEEDHIQPGAGLADLVNTITKERGWKHSFWSESPREASTRQMLRFGIGC